MIRIAQFPGKYIQGPGAIEETGKYASIYGDKAMIFGSPSGLGAVEKLVTESLGKEGVEWIVDRKFSRECSYEEVDRLEKVGSGEKAEMVIGVGGGKALDTAKALSFELKKPVLIVPTIAATDAPCSALSVMYTVDHIFKEYRYYPKNPDCLVVDTEVIAKAPTRLLVSGMGDALATWWEADACARGFAKNCTVGAPGPGYSTISALALAKLCYETLLNYGIAAKASNERGAVTPALERIVEANTLLSGIGFESSGLAAAHAIYDGFTLLESVHRAYHGELVAFGTIVQLILEGRSKELTEVMGFCRKVELPLTLEDINLGSVTDEELMSVAKKATEPGETMHNMPFPVESDDVFNAIKVADSLGEKFKEIPI